MEHPSLSLLKPCSREITQEKAEMMWKQQVKKFCEKLSSDQDMAITLMSIQQLSVQDQGIPNSGSDEIDHFKVPPAAVECKSVQLTESIRKFRIVEQESFFFSSMEENYFLFTWKAWVDGV